MTDRTISNKLRQMLQPQRLQNSSITSRPITDPRTPFESDYSRVLLSAPLRRLQDKAQVYPLADNDFVRTRLTHSIEVSRFAKDMGRGIEELLYKKGLLDDDIHQARWISSILEVVGLVHDIGNPPFGHTTEKYIQSFFKTIPNADIPEPIKQAYQSLTPRQRSDFEHFDGNAQGLRILLNLGVVNFNLTMPTLSAFIKYPYDSLTGNRPKNEAENHMQEKFGYFDCNEADYQRIYQTLGLKPNQRHPLTFVLEAADDIAYLVCDIEDGAKVGAFGVEDIRQTFAKHGCLQWIEEHLPHQINDEQFLHQLRIKMQGQMLNACVETFVNHIEQIVNGTFMEDLIGASSMKAYKPIFKELDIYNFISPAAVDKEEMGKQAIGLLLKHYMVKLFTDNHLSPETFMEDGFSENYWNKACEEGNSTPSDAYKKFMLITDYISGMTDGYTLQLARRVRQ